MEIEEPPPRTLRRIGVGGLGGGAAMIGLAGLLWITGRYALDEPSRRFQSDAALLLLITGGVMFVGGAGIVIYDYAVAPAPVGPGGGAGLVVAGSF